MNKKSAVTIAGGVAAALLAGLVAVSINMGILRASGSPAGPGKLTSQPIVKTEIQTVRERSPSKGSSPKTIVIPRPAAGSTTGSASTQQHEPDAEHEFGESDDD
jgi:hypothetical protein